MADLNYLSVELSCPDRTYHPGDPVSGQVIYATNKPRRSHQGIAVEIVGKARVEQHRRVLMNNYMTDEIYLRTRIVLNPSGSAIVPGAHKFPFSYTLPRGIPSSYNGKYGRVSYKVRVLAHPSLWDVRKRLQTVQKEFRVVAELDLNANPKAMEQVVMEKRIRFKSFLGIKPGPYHIAVRLPRSGYIPGETILINAMITNNSFFLLVVEMVLRQVVEFRFDADDAAGKVLLKKKDVAKVPDMEIRPKETTNWCEKRLQVPLGLPPTDLGGDCGLIKVRYELKVTEAPGIVHLRLPVILGTVPLRPPAEA